MKRAALIAAACAAIWGAPAVAAAPAPSAGLIDELRLAGAADAPIVVRIDPAALPAMRDLVRARVPSLLRGGFDRAVDSIGARLGGDPLTPEGRRALGLDPSRPIVIVLGLDGDVRAIVAVRDGALAAQTITRARTLAPAAAIALHGDLIAIDSSGRAEPPSDAKAVTALARTLTANAPIAARFDPRLVPAPAELRPILDGSFGVLTATLELHGAVATVHATWDVVRGSALARACATTTDSGLPRPTDTPDAALHVHTYADLSALAGVPTRGMTYDLPSRPFVEEGEPPASFDLLAWPYELGATMAHVISVEPRAKPLFGGARDAALVVSSIGDDLDHTAAAIELAIDPSIAPTVEALVDDVWGPRDAGAAIWGAGRIRAFARPGAPTLGVAVRDSAPAYLALVRHAPTAPRDLVLEVHAAPAALALLDPLAFFAGSLDLTARYDGRALAIDATLSP